MCPHLQITLCATALPSSTSRTKSGGATKEGKPTLRNSWSGILALQASYRRGIPSMRGQTLTTPLAVVESDGDDVDSDWVATSNWKLAEKMNKKDARKPKAKRKQKASRPPLPQFVPARRGTPPLEVCVSHASASSAQSETAGPSNSTRVTKEAACVGSSTNVNQQVEAQDADMLRVCLCLYYLHAFCSPRHLNPHSKTCSPSIPPTGPLQDQL